MQGTIAEATQQVFEELCEKHGYLLEAIEVMPDHVHLLVSIPPALAISTAVKLLKGASARLLFIGHPELKRQVWGGHLWNPSYYVGTAGEVSKATIQRYIERQKQDATADH